MKRKFTKFTRILAAFLCLTLFVPLCTGLFGNFDILAASTDGVALDLFRSYGMNVDLKNDADGESYISVTSLSGYSGSKQPSVEFVRSFAGEFSMKFDYAASANSIACFTVGDGNTSFNIYLQYSGESFNTYVEYMGVMSGICYDERGLMVGNSLAMNDNGIYTEIEATDEMTLTFDAASMAVSIGNGSVVREVWNFTGEFCDGILVNKIAPFKTYNVKMSFTGSAISEELKIYEVNKAFVGDGKIASTAKPSIMVLSDYNALAGEEFILPAPITGDLVDDDVEVEVSVENDQGVTVISNTPYADGLSFIADASAAYYIVNYVATNDMGNKVIYRLNVENYASEEDMELEYSYSFDMPLEGEFGLNTTINIPAVTLGGGLYTSSAGSFAAYDVYFNGVIEAGYENVLADAPTTLKFEKTGKYTVVFREADGLVEQNAAFEYDVRSDVVSLEHPVIPTASETCETLDIPTAYWVMGDIRQTANSKVVLPNGACYSNNRITLDESGVYEIVYYGTVDGKYYEHSIYVTVIDSPNTIFAQDGVSEFVWGTSNLTNKVSGVKVYTKDATAVRYADVIDLRNYTRNDVLVELMADVTTPGAGSTDFTQFTVTLTDIYDPSNVINIYCTYSTPTNGQGNGTYIKAGGTNQQAAGWYKTVQTTYGYQTTHSFQGLTSYDDISENTLKLYFDYATLSLYSGKSWGRGIDIEQDYLVTKFDDTKFYSFPWEGFTTGEVYLDITASGATKGSVGYTVLRIAKQDFTSASSMKDNFEAPILNLSQSDFPVALKGFDYKLPDATAKDSSNSDLAVSRRVFFGYNTSSQAEMVVTDGAFTPAYEGVYTVVYSATDKFGVTTTQEYEVNVVLVGDDITFDLDTDEEVINCYLGNSVKLPQVINISNAYGSTKVSVDISDGSSSITHELTTFKPWATGEYTVTYTVTDYHGRTSSIGITLQVSASDYPTLPNELVFPDAFISGTKFNFTMLSAIDYATDMNGVSVLPKIYVDGTLCDGSYTPAFTEDVTVKIRYEYEGSKETLVFEKDIPVVVVANNGKYDFTKFFVTDYAATLAENGIFFDTQSDGRIAFAKEVSTDGFRIELLLKTILGKNESITVKLTDPVTGIVEANAVITYSNGFKISFNGGAGIAMSSGIDESGNVLVGFYYSFSNNVWYDLQDTFLTSFEFDYMDETYTSFMNLTAKLSIDLELSSANTVGICKLNNQTFTSQTSRDRVGPEIYVGNVGGLFEINDVITIPAASAYDLLSNVASLQVSVMYNSKPIEDENGVLLNAVDATKEYTVKLTEYGSYSINYVAFDDNGNKVMALKQAMIPDFAAPEIQIGDGAYKSVYKKGDTVAIAKAQITDNLDTETSYTVYVITAQGRFICVGDSYVFENAGKYTIRYLAIDSNGNIAYKDFSIRVQ